MSLGAEVGQCCKLEPLIRKSRQLLTMGTAAMGSVALVRTMSPEHPSFCTLTLGASEAGQRGVCLSASGGKLIFSRKERWGAWLWLSTRRECFKEGGVISQSEAAGATSMASALAPWGHSAKGAVTGAGVGMKWLRSEGRHSPPSTSVAAEGRGKGVASFILYVFTRERDESVSGC